MIEFEESLAGFVPVMRADLPDDELEARLDLSHGIGGLRGGESAPNEHSEGEFPGEPVPAIELRERRMGRGIGEFAEGVGACFLDFGEDFLWRGEVDENRGDAESEERDEEPCAMSEAFGR